MTCFLRPLFRSKPSDALKNETTLIAFLVRVAVHKIGCNAVSEGLALGRWNDSQLVRLQTLLAAHDLLNGYVKALKSEVAIALQTIDTTRLDGGFVMFVHELEPKEGCRRFTSLRWVPRGWFDQNKATVVENIYDNYLPMIDVSKRRLFSRRIQDMEATLENIQLTPYNVVAKLMVAPLPRSATRVAFGITRSDLLLIACALERHRVVNRRFPDSLSALVPRFTASLPLDIFTG